MVPKLISVSTEAGVSMVGMDEVLLNSVQGDPPPSSISPLGGLGEDNFSLERRDRGVNVLC